MQKHISLAEVPAGVMTELGKYVSNTDGSTFLLRDLPPELTGGVLARYSRARTPLRLTLVNEFLDQDGRPCQEKGSALMHRVLVAFGDESVGELEGAHVGMEDVSQLLTKYIEDRRIGGSPIEQSTRYVIYDQTDGQGRWRYLRPQEVITAGLLPQFEAANDRAFEVYKEGVGLLIDHFKREFPRDRHTIPVERGGKQVMVGEAGLQGDAENRAFRNSYNFTVRCAALDVGRCVLPSSTLTHLGVFGNGRYFTNLITHLKSCGLAEASERGNALEQELNTEIPTFVKRNRLNPQVVEIDAAMKAVAHRLLGEETPIDAKVTLVKPTAYIDEVVAACLFPYSNLSLQQILNKVGSMDLQQKGEVLETYRGNRETRFDRTGRGLEAGYPITFDLVGGFAEYRDLERHRMLTQQRQLLSTELGFIMPPEMSIINLEQEVEEVVGMTEELNVVMCAAGLDQASQYATLFNHRIRWTMGMNLREFQHLSELRTQPAGHFSYRAMVMEMVNQLVARDPLAETFLEFVNFDDPDNRITRAAEQQKIAGKNLAAGSSDDGLDLR